MHQYDKFLSYIDYFSTAGEEAGIWAGNDLYNSKWRHK